MSGCLSLTCHALACTGHAAAIYAVAGKRPPRNVPKLVPAMDDVGGKAGVSQFPITMQLDCPRHNVKGDVPLHRW